ncbi:MAG: hypothetical protein LBV08_05030, partial [Clostridiales bacterium]|nr:hypothetical protein [Clostridiales bacterium]
MFEIIKPGLILFAISLVASLSLGVVNEVTKAPIAALELQTEKDAQLELFPEATEFAELINFEKTNSVTKVVEALNGNELIGYILSAEPRGYGGPISMVVAISSDGSARGVKIL